MAQILAVAISSFPILDAEWFFIKATRIDGNGLLRVKNILVNEIFG